MASPQCEDGFTKIANELFDALIRTNFSGYQRRVLDAIIRKTYGFNKKADHIAYSQIIEMTGIKMPHVSRALKELRLRRIVTKGGNKIGINKDYSQWQQLPKGVSSHHKLPKGVTTVTKGGKKKLPKGGDTKDTLKDNYTKYSKDVIDHLNKVKGGKGFTYTLRNLSYPIARLKEGHTIEDLKAVVDVKWKDSDFNKKYFRPSTLFNSDKFEGYLMEASNSSESDKSWDI